MRFGAYGLIIEDEKILLIRKHGGPYDNKLDLPGGTIQFCERPEEALVRELFELKYTHNNKRQVITKVYNNNEKVIGFI